MKPPEPGLHRDVPFATYTSWDAANAHGLITLDRKTAAHLRWDLDHGEGKETPAREFGHLFHLAILEPDRFEREVVVAPKVRRVGAGRAVLARFEAEHHDKLIIPEATMERIRDMQRAVLSHETAAEILSGAGLSEVSVTWVEEGMPCKARIDRLATVGEQAVIVDLKTTNDASARSFERQIHQWGYHIQGAHYVAGVEAVAPQPAGNPHRRYLCIACEKDPPYATAVYEIDDFALSEGDGRRKHAIGVWRDCRERDVWPGYQQGVETASVPPWAVQIFDNSADL